jgi:putative ABC transport system substrate-binding protein
MSDMRRREFITLIGGVAAWPLAARAQQPALPVVGFLDGRTPDAVADRVRAFRQGLSYVEGENVAIIYRFAEDQIDRLPELAADLVGRQVAVIVSRTTPTALALKAATTTIPIVFAVGVDPVRLGLVASLARPGGNLTGVNFFNLELAAKRLELLRELAPGTTGAAVLVNPANPANAETTLLAVPSAARPWGCKSRSSTPAAARRSMRLSEPSCASGPTPSSWAATRRIQLVHLATRHAVPATFPNRDYPAVGGLMSYGTSITDAYRQVGIYAGRILA